MFKVSNLRSGSLYGKGLARLFLLGVSTLALTGCNSEGGGGKQLPPQADGTPTVKGQMQTATPPADKPSDQGSTFVTPGGK